MWREAGESVLRTETERVTGRAESAALEDEASDRTDNANPASSADRGAADTMPGVWVVASVAWNRQQEPAESAAVGAGVEPSAQRGQLPADEAWGMEQPRTWAATGAVCAATVRPSKRIAAILRIIARSMVTFIGIHPRNPSGTIVLPKEPPSQGYTEVEPLE